MMVPAKQGLIINVSSIGGLKYYFNVAYGVGKAAVCLFHYFEQNVLWVRVPGMILVSLSKTLNE